jgi:uncharacterized FlgJ-related protein
MKKIQIVGYGVYETRNEVNKENRKPDNVTNVDTYSIYSEFREYKYIGEKRDEKVSDTKRNTFRDIYSENGKGKHYVNLGKVMEKEVKYGIFMRK